MIRRLQLAVSENFAYLGLDARMSKMLMPAQMRAVTKLTRSRGGLVWWKVGEGKTRIAVFLFAALQNAYRWSAPSICLVVCRRSAFLDWREEIHRCFVGASVYENEVPAHPPGNKPVFLLVSGGDMCETQRIKGKIVDNESYWALRNNLLIRFVILDESWMYANNKSARFKAAYRLTNDRKSVALSGTVMKARDLSEVYNQAAVVHKHKYLADTLTKFRGLVMTSPVEVNGFPGKPRPKKGAYAHVMRCLEEVADVHFPKGSRLITEQYHNIPATKQQREYFNELREFYSLEDFEVEYDHAIVISVKAQQISNGWIKKPDGKIVDISSNKPEKLEDELRDIVAGGQKAVVWCAFRHDVEMLADRIKLASVQMLSGTEFDIDRWRNGDARVCFATEASGSSVNHFSDTAYAIYFSSNHKWLDMQQSRGRTDRKSSQHPECFYKYLQVDGSFDSQIYRIAMESGAAESALLLQASVNSWLEHK